jgi:hypothetical protein
MASKHPVRLLKPKIQSEVWVEEAGHESGGHGAHGVPDGITAMIDE